MQMINCDKCGKPIDHMDKFTIQAGVSGVIHIDCDNPKGGVVLDKTIPMFTWENKARTV